MNSRKGKHVVKIWFKSENEFNKLMDLVSGNDKEEAGLLITDVLIRSENNGNV